MTRPKIVCLCGSGRFWNHFAEHRERLTLEGYVVLGPEVQNRPEDKRPNLDALHNAKIRMADEILVVNVGGYIGDGATTSIVLALALGIPVNFTDPVLGDKFMNQSDRMQSQLDACFKTGVF
jgi:hypothetical protein